MKYLITAFLMALLTGCEEKKEVPVRVIRDTLIVKDTVYIRDTIYKNTIIENVETLNIGPH